jgi:hypothetical protein
MKSYDVFYEVRVIRCVRVAAHNRDQAQSVGFGFANQQKGFNGMVEVAGTVKKYTGEPRVLSHDKLLRISPSPQAKENES